MSPNYHLSSAQGTCFAHLVLHTVSALLLSTTQCDTPHARTQPNIARTTCRERGGQLVAQLPTYLPCLVFAGPHMQVQTRQVQTPHHSRLCPPCAGTAASVLDGICSSTRTLVRRVAWSQGRISHTARIALSVTSLNLRSRNAGDMLRPTLVLTAFHSRLPSPSTATWSCKSAGS